jgi:hypothetical protein
MQLLKAELRFDLPHTLFLLRTTTFRLGVLTYSYFVRATTIEVNGTTLYSDFWGSEAGGILTLFKLKIVIFVLGTLKML